MEFQFFGTFNCLLNSSGSNNNIPINTEASEKKPDQGRVCIGFKIYKQKNINNPNPA